MSRGKPKQLRATSRDALAEMQEHLARYQRMVYRAVKVYGPLTDEEIVDITKLSPSTARPRRIELVARGLVKDSGRRAKTHSGRQAIAWEASR